MNEFTEIRENSGSARLGKVAVCFQCHKPLVRARKYRVRIVSRFAGSIAFYYSHLRCLSARKDNG